MAQRANPTVIGAFVVGAVFLVVVGLMTFGRSTFFQREYKMVAHFQSSVKGLDVGAPVLFQGVRVGRVSKISAEWTVDQEEIRVPVELTFTPGAVRDPALSRHRALQPMDQDDFAQDLVGRGLRGELRLDSLVTGKLYVALVFHLQEEPRLLGDTDYPELPTVESGFLKIQKELEDLPTGEVLTKTLRAIDAIDELVNSGKVEELVDRIISLARTLEEQVVPLSESLQETLAQARGEMGEIKGQVRDTTESIQTLAQNADAEVKDVSAALQGLIENADASVGPLTEAVTATLDEARAAVASMEEVFGEDPTMLYRTAAALEELAAAARSVRQLADYIERHPEALISGKRK